MVARVTVSLSDEVVGLLDAEAAELGVPRSQLVQESIVSYLGKTREERRLDARRRSMIAAMERMRSMQERFGRQDRRSSAHILREIRDADDAATLCECERGAGRSDD
jgi:metal-responsive CopG/Arc/MetJ family transcriptional regulator